MSNVLLERTGAILRIEINRLDKSNALTFDMYEEIAKAIIDGDNDPSINVFLIHGKDGCFTAGNDMQDLMSDASIFRNSPIVKFMKALAFAQKPIVFAVSGLSIGIGTAILLHGDLVYAAPESRFQFPFVNFGLVPEAGSTFLLPYMIGHARASEMMLLGDIFDAHKAVNLGIVTDIAPFELLLDFATNAARRLSLKPPSAVQAIKKLLRQPYEKQLELTIDNEMEHFVQQLDTPECKKALKAFFEKRKADMAKFS